MSYDVDLYADLGGPELSFVEEVGNYTSNVSEMWRYALGYPLHIFDGTPARDMVLVLESAIAAMRDNTDYYRTLNPPNSWGNYEGALYFLEQILAACRRHPGAIVRVRH